MLGGAFRSAGGFITGRGCAAAPQARWPFRRGLVLLDATVLSLNPLPERGHVGG